MKLIVEGDQKITGLIGFEHGAVMTSYIPIAFAIEYFKNPQQYKGLLTPNKAFTFSSLNNILDELGWKIEMKIEKE